MFAVSKQLWVEMEGAVLQVWLLIILLPDLNQPIILVPGSSLQDLC